MTRRILHIDFNSYFATVEQQANPRLRGKPVGVTGGDRMQRTVLGAASVEAKRRGVKTGMMIWEAKKLCPELIVVPGDSDKYLACTQRFLNILKDYSPYLEIFSIDECFLETTGGSWQGAVNTAGQIKQRIRAEVGEWISCSVGISYNKIMAKLAGSLYKPDGLVVITEEQAAQFILDRVALDDICGIGSRTKRRLYSLGVTDFKKLRQVPKETLLIIFKSYGEVLYNLARGIDNSPITPFYEKGEVKSVGHRHTIDHDTASLDEIKQILLKLTELIARRLRAKNLVGKTVNCWFRNALDFSSPEAHFDGDGQQLTIQFTNDGLDIFNGAFKIFRRLWQGQRIRMIGASISNLKSQKPENLTFLADLNRQKQIIKALDKINDRYGEFTLKRGILLGTAPMRRKPNPYLSDRRFKT